MCQKMANRNQVSNFNVRMDYSVTALHVCVGGGGGVVSMPVTVWFPSIPVHVQSSKQLIKRYWLWPHPFFYHTHVTVLHYVWNSFERPFSVVTCLAGLV